MSQILDPIPEGGRNHRNMSYLNATSSIQVARITNISNWYFERVVFPGQRLIFEAPLEASLEIHTGIMASSILSDTIPCDRLVLEEELPQSRKAKENQQVIEYQNEGIEPESAEQSLIPKQLIKNLELSVPPSPSLSIRSSQTVS
jgi:hypothetical protein